MAKKTPVACRIDIHQARALWARRQGLTTPEGRVPGSDSNSVAGVLEQTGWARTLGGVDVYTALWARRPQLVPSTVDEATMQEKVRILPAARGCMYLVPEAHVPTTLALAAELSRPRVDRDLAKVGVPRSEVDEVAAAVLQALAAGPLETNAIRQALPKGSVRGLGDIGKKVGLSSPLPVALRELEFRGEIHRLPVGERLDTERYVWALTEGADSAAASPRDREAIVRAAVELAFRFFAPASVKEIGAWLGLAQREVKAAMADLPLVPIHIVDRGDAWLQASVVESLEDLETEDQSVSFLAFEDNLLTFYGGPGIFADPRHADVPLGSWGRGKAATLGTARHPTNRCLFVGSRLVGFWEFDAAASTIVFATFEPLPAAVLDAVRNKAEALGEQVFRALGHGRSFSLDSDAAVVTRAQAIRQMA